MSLFNRDPAQQSGYQGPTDFSTLNGSMSGSFDETETSTTIPAPPPASTTPQAESYQSETTIVTSNGCITLRVGDHIFRASKATLLRSPFIDELMARLRADTVECFIDADGDMFQHILTFLRHSQAPLFWNHQTGINYPLYQRLRTQAALFRLHALVKWIDDKRYLAVGHQHIYLETKTFATGENLDYERLTNNRNLGDQIRVCAIRDAIRTEYRCPRGLQHTGGSGCGKQCKAAGDLSVDIAVGEVVIETIETTMDLSVLHVDQTIDAPTE